MLVNEEGIEGKTKRNGKYPQMRADYLRGFLKRKRRE